LEVKILSINYRSFQNHRITYAGHKIKWSANAGLRNIIS
jgi:hypothetical protein